MVLNIRIRLAFLALPLLILNNGCGHKQAKAVQQENPKIEAIRQSGQPVTLAELNEWYAAPPAAENAGSLYMAAFAAMTPLQPTAPGFLAQNQKAIELFHQAASLKKCRYPIDLNDGAKLAQPYLANLRKGTQLLAQQASNLAAKGQMDLATQSLLDGLRLARSIEEEPLLLSRFIGISSENVIVADLEPILTRKGFSEPQLALMQTAFHEAETGVTLTRALAGERAMGIATFQMPVQEQLLMLAQNQKPPVTTDFEAYRKTPVFTVDFDFYLDAMEQGIAACALPFPKSLEGTSQWMSLQQEAKDKGYQISAMLLPALQTALERSAECLARLRVGQAALAIERYRLAHQNGLPEALGELTPQFLAEVPTDPFDGQPLRYQKNSSGFLVYSIGKDRTDNGGFAKPATAKTDAGCDLTFIVKR